MSRTVGTVSRGIRTEIIKQGDNLAQMVTDSVLNAAHCDNFEIKDKDIIGITESVVARAQGNYASIDHIARDIKNKFGDGELGVIFPILSRNRFAICLRGIARGAKKIYLMLSYPSDEVGNHLVTLDELDEKNVNPWTDVLTEKQYREYFGYKKHQFTGVDYIEYYSSIIKEEGAEVEVIFANDARTILNYTKNVLTCDIHTRARSKRILKAAGAKIVLGLDDIMTSSIDNSGYNENYGLLGSNKATESTVKLFPRDADKFAQDVQKLVMDKTSKQVEVLVYGDGAFKDPAGKIWELADPVVSPGYTAGLDGQPNEVKLKYLADNDFANLKGKELNCAIKKYIAHKDADLKGSMVTQGTTPRRLTDLIGSLCDLTSGSGDKGTPVIYIQGYFDNLSNE